MASSAVLREAIGDRFIWEEKFLQPVAANASIGVATNLNWELLGTSATWAALAAGGGRLGTANTNAATAMVFPHQDAAQTLLNTFSFLSTKRSRFEMLLTMDAAGIAADCDILGGFKLTGAADLTTDDDHLLIRISAGVLTLSMEKGGSSVGTLTPGKTFVAGDTVRLAVEINKVTNYPNLYLNNRRLGQIAVAFDGDEAFKPALFAVAPGTNSTARTVQVHQLNVGANFPLAA